MKRAAQIKSKIKRSKLKWKVKTTKETMSYQKTSWAEFVRSKNIQTKKGGKPKNKKCKIHSLQPSLE